jgi:hypothetical protein
MHAGMLFITTEGGPIRQSLPHIFREEITGPHIRILNPEEMVRQYL